MSSYILYSFSSFFISLPIIILYILYGRNNKILAYVNNRSLHTQPIITGAGLTIGLAIFFLMIFKMILNINMSNFTILLFVISFLFSIFGWVDDKYEIKAVKKFFLQIIISAIFSIIYLLSLQLSLNIFLNVTLIILLVILLVCSINTFNFMDGINGFALSLSLYIFISILVLNEQTEIKNDLIFIMMTLLILLYFNLTNKIFIGDSGSMMLGFLIGAVILNELIHKNINIQTILIIVAYWGSDTICTFIVRLFIVKKWYLAHRSHAYQNLARILKSHSKVLILINFIQFLFLLPLAFLSQKYISLSIYFLFLSYVPMIIFSLKYGPILSSD
jgi:Fuc2NAc and GlcNAc transferase